LGATFIVVLMQAFNPFGVQAKEYVWDGTDTNWDDTDNWNVGGTGGTDGTWPSETGDNVTFQDTSTQSCTITASGVTIGNLTMAASYDPNVQDVNGVLTVGGAFSCADLTISGGNFEHTSENTIIVSGNIVVGSGALLMLTGDGGLSKIDGGGTLTVANGGGVLIYGINASGRSILDVDDDVTINGELKIHGDTSGSTTTIRVMVASKTFTISSTGRVELHGEGAGTKLKMENLGVVNVSGTFWMIGGSARPYVQAQGASSTMSFNVLSNGSISVDWAVFTKMSTASLTFATGLGPCTMSQVWFDTHPDGVTVIDISGLAASDKANFPQVIWEAYFYDTGNPTGTLYNVSGPSTKPHVTFAQFNTVYDHGPFGQTRGNGPAADGSGEDMDLDAGNFVHWYTNNTFVSVDTFTAEGEGDYVNVGWQTAQETSNVGFNLYRSNERYGKYSKLNLMLIEPKAAPGSGASYTFVDSTAKQGKQYYYKLVDIDTTDKQTTHGPISVDWDRDGMPDDWERRHGLDPADADDAAEDRDGDGLSSLEEYERGTDPTLADTDRDGILDADDSGDYSKYMVPGVRSGTDGLTVLGEDANGITVELITDGISVGEVKRHIKTGKGRGHGKGKRVGYNTLNATNYNTARLGRDDYPDIPVARLLINKPRHTVLSAKILAREEGGVIDLKHEVDPTAREVDVFDDKKKTSVREVSYWPHPEVYGNQEKGRIQRFARTKSVQPASLFAVDHSTIVGNEEVDVFRISPLQWDVDAKKVTWYKKIRVRIDYLPDPKREEITLAKWRATYDAIKTPGYVGHANAVKVGVTRRAYDYDYDRVYTDVREITGQQLLDADIDLSKIVPAEVRVYRGVFNGERYPGEAALVETTDGLAPHLASPTRGEGSEGESVWGRLGGGAALSPEIPISVTTTSPDVFTVTDTIRFIGREQETSESDTTYFWLTYADSGAADNNKASSRPKRLTQSDGTLGLASTAAANTTQTRCNLYLEQNEVFNYNVDHQGDPWMFAIKIKPRKTKILFVNLPGLASDASEPIHWEGLLVARTNNRYVDHNIQFSHNGNVLGYRNWMGRRGDEFSYDIGASGLVDGENQLIMKNIVLPGGSYDIVYPDWFKVSYTRNLVAVNDRIVFDVEAFAGTRIVSVSGFTSKALIIYDISDPYATHTISPLRIEDNNGSYTAVFAVRIDAQHTYMVTGSVRSIAASTVTSSNVNDIRSNRDQVDHLIITHSTFASGAAELALDRASQGIKSRIVDVDDIYASYSGGTVTPHAIRMFLHETYRTSDRRNPASVVLVGNTHWDPKGHHATAAATYASLVPSYNLTDQNKPSVSDNPFVCLDGDDIMPDMAIGRLPVNNVEEMSNYLRKLKDYRDIPYGVNPTSIFVTDEDDGGFHFEAHAEEAISKLPDTISVTRKYADIENYSAGITQSLIDAANSNQAYAFAYFGHGGYHQWGAAGYFDEGQLANLNPGHKPLVFIESDCFTADFYSLAEQCLGDSAIRSPVGAVAYLGNTGLSASVSKQGFMRHLYQIMFNEERLIGLAHSKAKVQALMQRPEDVGAAIRNSVMLGDPTVKFDIPFPEPPASVEGNQEHEIGYIELNWAPAERMAEEGIHYDVYRSFDPPSKHLGKKGKKENAKRVFVKANDEPITEPTFTDYKAPKGKVRYYVIRAINRRGKRSGRSKELSFDTRKGKYGSKIPNKKQAYKLKMAKYAKRDAAWARKKARDAEKAKKKRAKEEDLVRANLRVRPLNDETEAGNPAEEIAEGKEITVEDQEKGRTRRFARTRNDDENDSDKGKNKKQPKEEIDVPIPNLTLLSFIAQGGKGKSITLKIETAGFGSGELVVTDSKGQRVAGKLVSVDKEKITSFKFKVSTSDNYMVILNGQSLSALLDSDGDFIPDSWEKAHGLDPQDPADAQTDPDGDGFTAYQDFIYSAE